MDQIFSKMQANLNKKKNNNFEARCLALFAKHNPQTQAPIMIRYDNLDQRFFERPPRFNNVPRED